MTAWDISSGSYASKSLSVAAQELYPRGLVFSTDGAKAYIVGDGSDTIYQYALSTAWDISTGSYASKSLSVATQDSTPTGLSFSSDGTKAYVSGQTSDTIYQYALSTAWDISTGSYASKSLSVSTYGSVPRNSAFSSDGTAFFILSNTDLTIYQYALSTAWDISTGSYDSKSLSLATQMSVTTGLAFSGDGTKVFSVGNYDDTIYQYALSTAWDISTGSYDSKSLSVASQESNPTGVAFSADGSMAYIAGISSGDIFQYDLAGSAANNAAFFGFHGF